MGADAGAANGSCRRHRLPRSMHCRSLAAGAPAPVSRQTRASQCRRPCGRLAGSAEGPALPKLRESPRCLLAARPAATCKHTWLSVGAIIGVYAGVGVGASADNGRSVCREPRSQTAKVRQSSRGVGPGDDYGGWPGPLPRAGYRRAIRRGGDRSRRSSRAVGAPCHRGARPASSICVRRSAPRCYQDADARGVQEGQGTSRRAGATAP